VSLQIMLLPVEQALPGFKRGKTSTSFMGGVCGKPVQSPAPEPPRDDLRRVLMTRIANDLQGPLTGLYSIVQRLARKFGEDDNFTLLRETIDGLASTLKAHMDIGFIGDSPRLTTEITPCNPSALFLTLAGLLNDSLEVRSVRVAWECEEVMLDDLGTNVVVLRQCLMGALEHMIFHARRGTTLHLGLKRLHTVENVGGIVNRPSVSVQFIARIEGGEHRGPVRSMNGPLNLCRGLAGSIGGSVEETTQELKVTIPFRKCLARAGPSQRFVPHGAATAAGVGEPLCIFLYDENVIYKTMIRKMLQWAGHVVDVLNSADDIGSLIRSLPAYDCLVLDLSAGGLEILKRIRRSKSSIGISHRIPIVGTIPPGMQHSGPRSLSIIVEKPVSSGTLLAAISDAINENQTGESSTDDSGPLQPSIAFSRPA
jgi:CheY-like chemotaxis protein